MITLPLRYSPKADILVGGEWLDVEAYYPGDRIRQVERASIRAFMENHRELLRGRVLDFGAGQKPYRELMQGGHYFPFEINDIAGASFGPFDTIMCNQVLQYIENVPELLDGFAEWLVPGGHLVMTYPTNWDEVEHGDLWRFTKVGMDLLLRRAGFAIVEHVRRAEVVIANFKFPLGYGVVCTRN